MTEGRWVALGRGKGREDPFQVAALEPGGGETATCTGRGGEIVVESQGRALGAVFFLRVAQSAGEACAVHREDRVPLRNAAEAHGWILYLWGAGAIRAT